jgi:hypothetical protein
MGLLFGMGLNEESSQGLGKGLHSNKSSKRRKLKQKEAEEEKVEEGEQEEIKEERSRACTQSIQQNPQQVGKIPIKPNLGID